MLVRTVRYDQIKVGLKKSEDGFEDALIKILKSAKRGLSVREVQHRLGPLAEGVSVKRALKKLSTDAKAVRLDGSTYAIAPKSFAKKVSKQRPAKEGGSRRRPQGDSRSRRSGGGKPQGRSKAEMLPGIRAGERNATKLLDQLSSGLGIDTAFSEEAISIAEAARSPKRVPADYRDMRDIPLVTIDGADAKDFDDAVYARAEGGDIILLVAIADVSHYVQEGSALDIEARDRGSSVYLPGRVYPMLPEALSNDVCSLKPRVNRRCAWVEIRFNGKGQRTWYDVGFGVMRSKARLTYTQVTKYFEDSRRRKGIPDEVTDSLRTLRRLWKRLNRMRMRRGTLDIELSDNQIVISDDGSRVAGVEARPRLEAHQLVEECMLAANETVADFFVTSRAPIVNRRHDSPDDEKLRDVGRLAEALDPSSPRYFGVPNLENIGELLLHFKGRPEYRVVATMVLRAMAKATYDVESEGHYGIGAGKYAHFTSPIRRYADLAVHRGLRDLVQDKQPRGLRKRMNRSMRDAAEWANSGEERAVKAERTAQRLLSALSMEDRVGEVFDAIITDIKSYGCFVALLDPPVDALMGIWNLNGDHYTLDEEAYALVGRRTGHRLQVGDVLPVRCIEVRVEEGKVGVAPAEE